MFYFFGIKINKYKNKVPSGYTTHKLKLLHYTNNNKAQSESHNRRTGGHSTTTTTKTIKLYLVDIP